MSGDNVCHEDMGSDPCDAPAVGIRLDPNYGGEYPVCEEHHRPPFPGDDIREYGDFDEPGFREATDMRQDRDL